MTPGPLIQTSAWTHRPRTQPRLRSCIFPAQQYWNTTRILAAKQLANPQRAASVEKHKLDVAFLGAKNTATLKAIHKVLILEIKAPSDSVACLLKLPQFERPLWFRRDGAQQGAILQSRAH
jgi:hypothetical protein